MGTNMFLLLKEGLIGRSWKQQQQQQKVCYKSFIRTVELQVIRIK